MFRGEMVGKSWGNFKRINANLREHMGTIKKARRLGNYCVYAVITYLLALTLILGGDEGTTPYKYSIYLY